MAAALLEAPGSMQAPTEGATAHALFAALEDGR